jgi:hypothetical protein
MHHEIADRHFSRHDEGRGPGEQADEQQHAADDLDESGDTNQRHHLQIVERRHMGKSEMLGQAVLQKKQRRDDPQNAERTLRPDMIDFEHLILLPPGGPRRRNRAAAHDDQETFERRGITVSRPAEAMLIRID